MYKWAKPLPKEQNLKILDRLSRKATTLPVKKIVFLPFTSYCSCLPVSLCPDYPVGKSPGEVVFLYCISSLLQAYMSALGFMMGFCMYGAISLLGTIAVEVAPIHMTGTAHGIVGLAANRELFIPY